MSTAISLIKEATMAIHAWTKLHSEVMRWISGAYECKLCMALTWTKLWQLLACPSLSLSTVAKGKLSWVVFILGFFHIALIATSYVSLITYYSFQTPLSANQGNMIESKVFVSDQIQYSLSLNTITWLYCYHIRQSTASLCDNYYQ